MINEEVFTHKQPLGNSDPALTAVAPSGITTATPALTPLMLSGKNLVEWDGAAPGQAVGILALALTGTETTLNFYKSGTFNAEDIAWPAAVADDDLKRTAFIGTAISVI